MAYCAQCNLEFPHLVKGQAFCVAGHLLYTFAFPGEAVAAAWAGSAACIPVEVRNTGAWDATIRGELSGALTEAGARVVPDGPISVPHGEVVQFAIEVPPERVAHDLTGLLKIRLDPGVHRLIAMQPRVQSNLPSIPVRLNVARSRIVVEPTSLEFNHDEGVRLIKVRNTGTQDTEVWVDPERTSRELDVTGASFPCNVGAPARKLAVSVLWSRLPPDQPEVRLNLVVRTADPTCPPVTVPVLAHNERSHVLKVPLGIDFGPMETVVSCVPPDGDGETPVALKIQGRERVPTVVAVKRTDPESRFWGAAADGLSASTRDYALIRSVATDLGSQDSYEILRWDAEVREVRPAAVYSPQEIAAFYLRELLTEARRELTKLYDDETVEVGTVVLTHPANWTNAQRNAVCEAFSSAGLPQQRLETRSEARAAAMGAFQHHANFPNASILVYGFGCGVVEATILHKTTGEDGLSRLEEDGPTVGEIGCGRDSLDVATATYLTEQLNTQHGKGFSLPELVVAPLGTDAHSLSEQLLALARDANERLCCVESVQVRSEVTLADGQSRVLTAEITRSQLESWVGERLRKVTARVLDGVFQSANKTKSRSQLNLVLLVGRGGVQIPAVESAVRAYFAGSTTRVVAHSRPELASSLGAAVMANRLAGFSVGALAGPVRIVGRQASWVRQELTRLEVGWPTEASAKGGSQVLLVVHDGGALEKAARQEVDRALANGVPVLPLVLPPGATGAGDGALESEEAAARLRHVAGQVRRLLNAGEST